MTLRLGIDLGGTKIAGVVLGTGGGVLAERRVGSPRGDYRLTIRAICDMIDALESELGSGRGAAPTVGIGMPGSISPATGGVQNSNSTWLNGQAFDRDIADALGRPVRVANDANCFALSEAVDGAGAGAVTVFGVILGTGCGGGIVRDGELVDGPLAIAGEWGHLPLPWATVDECPGPACWCGRRSCLETWISGPAVAEDHARRSGVRRDTAEIAALAEAGDPAAAATIGRLIDRLGRGLGMVTSLIDPDVIVLGGGVSLIAALYERLPAATIPHVFADAPRVRVRPAKWGDASGVRGAAWLWGR